MSNAAAKHDLFPMDVEVEITDEENTIRMKDHLEIEFKIDATKALRAAKMAEFNADLKALREQRSELITTIKTKKEKRKIECFRDPDFRRNTMFIKRADTGAVIEERALTAEERQETLPGTNAKPAKGAKPPKEGDDNAIVDNDYKPDGVVEGAQGGAEPKPEGGPVRRIKASDVAKERKKRKDKAGQTAVESDGAGGGAA